MQGLKIYILPYNKFDLANNQHFDNNMFDVTLATRKL